MAVVPDTHEFVGGVATTSEANAFIRDPIRFLLNPPIAELTASSAQSINNATATAVQLTAETVDDDVDGVGGHDNVTTNTRYIARYAGWYRCSGAVGWAANATGVRVAWWAVNGSVLNNATGAIQASAANILVAVCRTKLVYLNVADYVELIGYQTSGGALNTTNNAPDACSMSVHWVSN